MFASTLDWSQMLPSSDADGNGSSGDAFTAHGLPTEPLGSKASQPTDSGDKPHLGVGEEQGGLSSSL